MHGHGVFRSTQDAIRKRECFGPLQTATEEQQVEGSSCKKHLSHDCRYAPHGFSSPEMSGQGLDGPQALQEAAHSTGWATGLLAGLGDHKVAGENSVTQAAHARVTQLLTVAEVLFFYLLRDSKGGAGPQTSTSRSTWDPSSFVPGVASFIPISQVGSVNHSTPGRKPRPAALIAGMGLTAISQRPRGVHCKFQSLGVTT